MGQPSLRPGLDTIMMWFYYAMMSDYTQHLISLNCLNIKQPAPVL